MYYQYVWTPEQTQDYVRFRISVEKLGLFKVLYAMHVTQHHAVFLQELSPNSKHCKPFRGGYFY